MDIILHNKDLRVRDNKAVSETDNGLPLFILDPNMMEESSARRVAWMLENLRSLREEYRNHGSDLVVKRGETVAVLEQQVDERDVDRVLFNRSYTPTGKEICERIRSEIDIETESYHDKVLHTPESIYTNKGTPYSVFTYYYKKWVDRSKEEPKSIGNLKQFSSTTDIPSITSLDYDQIEIDLPPAGTKAAKERLEEFCSDDIAEYSDNRDYPSKDGTSRISAYLSYGVIGIREVWQTTEEYGSVDEFQEQLAWRDFYHQVLYHNPHVVTDNYKSYENDIQWENDDQMFEKWKNGRTGYPIVDAGMRQLKEEGYMHNRVRMIVASFLTKDLLIDWRWGYDWFTDMLLDHNVANNNGGWQWAASTGTDAQPYFRIFNPMTQGERYDPDAEYIQEYVEELEDAEPDLIHKWNEIPESKRKDAAPDYVNPIVDHSERRERAMNMYKRARGDLEEE